MPFLFNGGIIRPRWHGFGHSGAVMLVLWLACVMRDGFVWPSIHLSRVKCVPIVQRTWGHIKSYQVTYVLACGYNKID